MGQQHQLPPILGLPDNAGLQVATQAMSTANTRFFFGIVPPANKTLNTVKFFVSAVSGTLGANDIVCEVWSMPAGAQALATAPASLLESRNVVAATPTGAAWVEVTGFGLALTGNTHYGVIIRNANGSPGTNNFTIRFVTGSSDKVMGAGMAGWSKKHSTDAGSTWVSQVFSVAGLRLGFSDSTYAGIPASFGSQSSVGDGVYATREMGALFTTAADVKLRVRGIAGRVLVTGSPFGSPRFRLYQGTTLVATTQTITHFASTLYAFGYFSSSLVLEASTSHRAVLGETWTGVESSANRYNLYEYVVDDTAASKALFPFGGWQKTYWDGSSWTNTDTNAPILWLILDTDDSYDSVGGGGGNTYSRGRVVNG